MEQNKQIDPRNIAKFLSGSGILTALGIGVFIYLLPILTTIVWQGVTLMVGLGVAGILGLVLTNKSFWRNMKAINEKIAKIFTFWLIEWDEFLLQEMEIKEAEQGREKIREQGNLLKGQVASKEEELREAYIKLKESKNCVEALLAEGRTNEDAEVQLYTNEYVRQEDFISTIEPLKVQIEELALLCDKVYKATDIKIKDAKAELKLQKVKLESYTAGETAMTKALSIFTAERPEVALAKETVKRKIGEKIGSIRNTLDIINPIMSERSLKDRVKVTAALEQMKTINITGFQTIQPTKIESTYKNLLN